MVDGNAGPRDVHGSGVGNRDDANGTGFMERFPALTDRLVVGREGAGEVSGRTSKVDGNLTIQVQAGKLVEVFFGDLKAVADKDERRRNGSRGVSQAGTDVGVVDGGEVFGLASIHESDRRLGFVDVILADADGLIETFRASGLKTGLLELLDGVGLCFAETFAAGVASFERIIGKEFDVRPPGVAVEVRSGSLLGGNDDGEQKNTETLAHAVHSGSELKRKRIAGTGLRVTDE